MSRKLVLIAAVLLATTFVALLANVVYIFQKASNDQELLQTTSDIRVSSYRVVSLSREAVAGQPEAFKSLKNVVEQMDMYWRRLQRGLATEVTSSQLTGFEDTWGKVNKSAETIIADEDRVIFLNEVADTLNETLPKLQQEHTRVVEILLENNAPADQVAVAQNQTWLAERIGRNIDKMLAGGEDAEAAADQFNRDANLFGRVLEGMRKGDRALGISRITNRTAQNSLDKIAQQFEFVNNSIQEIFEATPVLFAARQANNTILESSPVLLEEINKLSSAISGLASSRPFTNQTAGFLVGLLVLWGALIAWTFQASTRSRLKETAKTNEQNQEAILRLLDEIGDLGEGDLTSHATVTEDFTGAIADSINYAIDQLRILVSQIQDTSENVSAAANETRATALQLSDSANHQSEQIAAVTESVNEMVGSINQVSENAAESAKVAEQSVSIAAKGSSVVRNTISGMDVIREQIQDTSKRIKRLGESSQEIGDIVSLINDIADQTNILALNAAIQASMAGDAGRGFAVVADEVQRLAERSADATKRIGTLVKTIQNDTNDAVSSMEQTTTEVVRGASLAQDAGVALEEIETVSTKLEKLIQGISSAAKDQSVSASRVSRNMTVIKDITSQTLLGSQTTADSTGELADLAVSLRESVSGFKLPPANDESFKYGAGEQDLAETIEPLDDELTDSDVEEEPIDNAEEEDGSLLAQTEDDSPEMDEAESLEAELQAVTIDRNAPAKNSFAEDLVSGEYSPIGLREGDDDDIPSLSESDELEAELLAQMEEFSLVEDSEQDRNAG